MTPDTRFQLRDATQALHERVDKAFAVFDLSDGQAYAAALSAHARVVPALEDALAPMVWSGFMPRGPLLTLDLADLGRPMPDTLAAPDVRQRSAAWGAQYVLEGSRLGGAILEKQVAPTFPHRYLGAVHADGGWRIFEAELNAAAKVDDRGDWLDTAVAAARAVFLMFERAVEAELESLSER